MKLRDLKGIGEKTEKYLNELGIFDVKDLLCFYPRDYEEYKEPVKIINVRVGGVYAIKGTIVTKPYTYRKGRMSITEVWIDDGTGKIRAYWFNFPFIGKTLCEGQEKIFRGKIGFAGKGYAITQPKMFNIKEYNEYKGKLNPVYHLVKGITNNVIKKAVKSLLDLSKDDDLCIDRISQDIIKKRDLVDYKYAINHIHFPIDYDDMLKARKRLVYDEFYDFSLKVIENKKKKKENGSELLKNADINLISEIVSKLDYELTNDQKNVINDIFFDMKNGNRINRLIEGDVGTGKTIVAILIALITIKCKMQVAFMAPTEVLAEQHFEVAKSIIEKFDKGSKINIVLLTGSIKSKDRKKVLQMLESGDGNFIIGTHALFSDDVNYSSLGLCIIDEEHRFGVEQRKKLIDKGENVGTIFMSATPIPRTLSMLMYADLDISILREKPKGRSKIKNCVIDINDREKAYKAIKKEIEKGHQAYVICPAIEESENDVIGSFANYSSVVEYSKVLKNYFGKFMKIEVLHGKMSNVEKYNIMQKFKNNDINILVSTTVIEVGVDVKNATFIMIEDAGAFGLAELHQLRGRVGRGENESYAVFVDSINSDKSKERLKILTNSNDGFYIAEEDLKLRGPGDIFGVRQSGEMSFKIGDIYTDYGLFNDAFSDAKLLDKT